MTKLKYLAFILGLIVVFNSCMKPDNPTEVQILTGEWEINDVIGQDAVNLPDDELLKVSKLHLDRNETFLFINVDGFAYSGTWDADDKELILTLKDGGTLVFNIVYLDYEKLHVYRTIAREDMGTVELRYLFVRV